VKIYEDVLSNSRAERISRRRVDKTQAFCREMERLLRALRRISYENALQWKLFARTRVALMYAI